MPPEIQDMISTVMAWIGALVLAGGGLTAIAFLLFKTLGEKWLNAKFEERLAAYRHAQQRELEQLKFEINTLMDRTAKLHQKEFDVLPETWGRLTDAFDITTAVTSPFQQHADLDRMNDEQLEKFLEGISFLLKWQKAELRERTDRNKHYFKASSWHKAMQARDACREFHVYLVKNGILIPQPMKSKFTELDGIIYSALVEYELNLQDEMIPRARDAVKVLGARGNELLKSLEDDVQGRLWKSERSDGTGPPSLPE
jgi:hypothetical protein